MDLRPGYKQTEVGVIPEDWELATIGTVAETSSGTTPPRALADRYYRNGHISWVKTLDLDNSEIYSTEEQVTLAALNETSLRCYPRGTVVVAMYGGFNQIGRTGLLSIPAAVNQALTAIRPDAHRLRSEYLLYVLNYRVDYWKTVASSSRKDPNITSKDVRDFVLALPCTNEQEAIAEALGDADTLIEFLEQLLTKKRQLKQGAMQELLYPKCGWQTVKLGSLGVFLKGCGVRKDESLSGDIPCVRYGEIYTRHSDFIKDFYSWVSSEVADTAVRLKQGDLLFAGSGETKEEIGKCVAFVDDVEAYAGGDIVIFRPGRVDSMFLGYYLNTAQINCQKAARGQGDAVVHISAAALADIDVALPHVNEQTAIATILSDMDADISALEAKLSKARAIKQGMMQQLLTGNVRLIEREPLSAECGV